MKQKTVQVLLCPCVRQSHHGWLQNHKTFQDCIFYIIGKHSNLQKHYDVCLKLFVTLMLLLVKYINETDQQFRNYGRKLFFVNSIFGNGKNRLNCQTRGIVKASQPLWSVLLTRQSATNQTKCY